MVVPRDSVDFFIVNKFIYLLLDKKVNRRVCNFTRLKQTEFFENFNWDDLIDFRIKAPYIPKSTDFSENLKNCCQPYESFNGLTVYLNFYFFIF